MVEPIRFSRLGALQIPIAESSGGISARELFEIVIRVMHEL
ncbi:MAG: hypothetical protein RMY27_14890 [Nostoc sp. DedQUE09]|nr:hypothetical protein [Nostoc sp. DedQUE09]